MPAKADIVASLCLPTNLLVTDTNSGLYVLDRPPEGRSGSRWDDVKLAAGVPGVALMMSLIVVPKLLMGWSLMGGLSRRRAPAPSRRRR